MFNGIVNFVAGILLIFAEYSCIIGNNEEGFSGQFKREDIQSHSTCGSKVPGTDMLLCHCDELCAYYKDCCHIYVHRELRLNQTSDLMSKVHRTECKSFPGDQNSYLMHNIFFDTTRLPVSATRFIKLCQKPTNTNPFEAIPVYSSQFKAHFRNDLCLKLFLRITRTGFETKSLAVWSVSLSAVCFQKYLNIFRTRRLFGTYMEFLALVFSRKYCNISLVPPEDTMTRICFQQDLKGCEAKEVCESYQSPVVDEIGRMYKNAHCAGCSGSHLISRLGHGDKIDSRETRLTLTHLLGPFEPYVQPLSWGYNPFDICRLPTDLISLTPTSRGCNLTCPDDKMRYFNTCVQPISKARGFLYQLELKISSVKTLSLDHNNKAKITRAVLNMIGPFADFYVISKRITAKTMSSDCLHIVDIAIYLRKDVMYKEYLNISTYVKEIFGNRKKELENEILNMTLKGDPCLTVGTSYNDGGSTKRQAFMTDMIRVVIFSSIFGVIIVAVLVVTVIKVVINKLTRNRETETNE